MVTEADGHPFDSFWFFFVLLFVVRMFVIVVDGLQKDKHDNKVMPTHAETSEKAYINRLFSENEFELSQKYNHKKGLFNMWRGVICGAVELLVWAFFIYPQLWDILG